MRLYSIYCKTTNSYDVPFPCENDARAVYELRHMINTYPDSSVAYFADEHSLFCVGEFNSEKGNIKPVNEVVCKELSYLKKKEKEGDEVVSNVV